MLRDELHHAGNADDLAEDAARRRYEEYRADDHERLVRHVVELGHLARLREKYDAEDDGDRERYDRRAEEGDEGNVHLSHREGRGDAHEENRDDDRREGHDRARKLAVLLEQLFVGLDRLAGGLRELVLRLDALTDISREDISRDKRRNREQHSEADDEQHLVAYAEKVRRGYRSGRRRYEAVRDVKAHRERDRHGDARNLRALDERLSDRVQDDEAAVTEDGDRNYPAHDEDREVGVLLADELDDDVRHLERRARLFEQDARQGAEDYDDAYAREGPGEAGADGPRNLLERDARDEREEERDRHNREERMNLELRNRYDHCDDCYYKHNNKRYACHHK